MNVTRAFQHELNSDVKGPQKSGEKQCIKIQATEPVSLRCLVEPGTLFTKL
jgi:hypothetical protein